MGQKNTKRRDTIQADKPPTLTPTTTNTTSTTPTTTTPVPTTTTTTTTTTNNPTTNATSNTTATTTTTSTTTQTPTTTSNVTYTINTGSPSTTAPQWEYQEGSKWISFDTTTNRLLEGVVASGRLNTPLAHPPHYSTPETRRKVDFTQMTMESDDNKTTKVRRTPPLTITTSPKTSPSPEPKTEKKDSSPSSPTTETPQMKEVKKITSWKKVRDSDLTKDDTCPICMCDLLPTEGQVVLLSHCSGHYFHSDCITQCYKQGFLQCPICSVLYGIRIGNMPKGTMNVKMHAKGINTCATYSHCGTIQIDYSFPNGTQTDEHPNPGQPFTGTTRTAYLPDDDQGREILRLLKIGWERRLLFQVGRSVTTGMENQVVWGIHHKTALTGGSTAFGYPDPGYFDRVKQELSAKGVH